MARKLRPVPPLKTAGLTAAPPPQAEILPPLRADGRPVGHPRLGAIDGLLQFSSDQRAVVREMATWGVPFENIRQQIISPDTGKPITAGTLSRHFREELDAGTAEANTKIAKSAYLQAVGWNAEYDENGKCIRPFQGPIPQMTKWLTQVRLGYRDTQVVEINTGKPTPEALGNALVDLNYEDQLRVREIVQRRLQSGGDSA